jgi:phosphatidylinositol glycan class K
MFASVSTASQQQQQHTSNHAVIVSSSRYWFNYRHVMNALAIYDLIRKQGVPDSNIILMLADELPTNPRHPNKNHMDNSVSSSSSSTLYSQDVEIDFRGDEVTVENLAKVLLGRHDDDEEEGQTTRQLHTDEESNLLIYWTGHGGDQFFKFQDVEEITSREIARILSEMHDKKRFNEILFIADTCQAFTLGDFLSTSVPNVFFVGSSLRGENSYAHHSDPIVGLSVIERYTHAIIQFLKHVKYDLKQVSLKQGLVDHLRFEDLRAHVGYTDESCDRKFHDIPMSDFFANVQQGSPMEIPKVQEKILWKKAARVRDSDATTTNATETCSDQDASAMYMYQGLEPSDPLFIAVLMLFVGAIMISSQFV